MVFSSLYFILLFMPIFFACYYWMPDRGKNMVLLAGSLVFYYVGTTKGSYQFSIFLICIIMDFLLGIGMEHDPKRKKMFLLAGVCVHFLCLGFFKYTNFLFGELQKVIPDLPVPAEIILPIGISFYTFQGVSYLVDVYRGDVKPEKSLLNYAVYISMFAQLIAGPIVTYEQVRKELHGRTITGKSAFQGLQVFVFGLGLKVLLANPIGKLWTQTQAIGFESISTPLAWMAVIAYSFQIYFDFFGYSLMAIGLGKMLGFSLPQNFAHPYTSLTMSEFWRRWHMTLGSWFREYVYIPLGGNRKGKLRTVGNLLIVWLLTGIWHGAGYNFLLWGFVLFLLISVEKFWIGDWLSKHPLVGHAYMIFVIPLTWAVFAVTDMQQLKILFTRLFPFFGQGMWSIFRYDYLKYLRMYGLFFVVAVLFSTRLPYHMLQKVKRQNVIHVFLLVVLCASLYCMYRGLDDPFLYFRF